MAEEKGFIESLLDFSFRSCVATKYAKLLYALHLLAGLIVAIGLVLNGFRDSTAQGLLVLLLALVGLFFWTLYVRVALEFLMAVFRTAENIARASGANREP